MVSFGLQLMVLVVLRERLCSSTVGCSHSCLQEGIVWPMVYCVKISCSST